MAGGKNWCSDVKNSLTKVVLLTDFYDKITVYLKMLKIRFWNNIRLVK